MILNVDSISKSYKGSIFENISTEFHNNALYILFGPNGSGKTTFFNCLAGIMHPDHGRVMLNNENTLNHEQKFQISYLMASTELFPYLTAFEFLHFHFSIFKEKMYKDQKINQFFKKLDLEIDKDTIMDNLSTGMRQKVMLTSVLLRNVDVYILDEPSLGLDDATKHEVAKILHELFEAHKLVILSSHDTKFLEYLQNEFDDLSAMRKIDWQLGMGGRIFE